MIGDSSPAPEEEKGEVRRASRVLARPAYAVPSMIIMKQPASCKLRCSVE